MNVMESFSLKGKVALLTGGAGKYGRQFVSALAEAGAETYIASRNIVALGKVAAEENSRGYNVIAMKLNLESENSIMELRDNIISRSGKIDVLINNAVIRCAMNGWEQKMEDFDRSLHVNASALFTITRVFGDEMKKQENGSIINIASMMGMVGVEMANYEGTDMHPNPSPIYFYEKGGMINFTRWAASILGQYNIRVNCISPGGLLEKTHDPVFVKNYSGRTQLGRMANASDLKGILVFLASDASLYITGTNIPVDGGYTAK
ncbi:MAG: Short-chain dehydrogenase/reductase SDR [Candidatus Uhrbacteria bacterium GW2011_GWF2_39_13]|uniref:Short-chain dehydrogenase/reductase SDR n=1 Tax=Candidatus Uhrbacteria bacterium GW2011_GWF2_39_13 TaxID=1618995 RepID=A0A0G0MMP9_9BACT|nr:MAG: Short-chain dehydrogenase/reductase SDR [Candidatus Uhrbacteria bacterium GW2011_GWF2_39_13]